MSEPKRLKEWRFSGLGNDGASLLVLSLLVLLFLVLLLGSRRELVSLLAMVVNVCNIVRNIGLFLMVLLLKILKNIVLLWCYF